MSPNIISLGELLVEIMRADADVSHGEIGGIYKGPYPSGSPAIFIDSAARMAKPFNISTGYIGVVGNDVFGRCIIDKMKKDGIDTSYIRVDNQQTTGIAFNQYNSDGSRKFIFSAGAAGNTSVDDISEEYFSDVKALHIMGSALSISEQSREACYKALKIAKKQNPDVIISFDPNLRPEMLEIEKILDISMPVLKQTKILLPSGEEAEMLARVEGKKEACLNLLENGPEIVVLKQGSDGCRIFSKQENESIKIPAYKVQQIDPTGAGDSFGGAFIVGYLKEWNLYEIGKFASAVGALKVRNFGPMSDNSYEEVREFMEQR